MADAAGGSDGPREKVGGHWERHFEQQMRILREFIEMEVDSLRQDMTARATRQQVDEATSRAKEGVAAGVQEQVVEHKREFKGKLELVKKSLTARMDHLDARLDDLLAGAADAAKSAKGAEKAEPAPAPAPEAAAEADLTCVNEGEDEELEKAATRIQAIQRGKLARKKADAKAAQAAQATEAAEAAKAAEAAEADLTDVAAGEDPELEKAATRIQAMQRGKLARKKLEARSADGDKDAGEQAPAGVSAAAEERLARLEADVAELRSGLSGGLPAAAGPAGDAEALGRLLRQVEELQGQVASSQAAVAELQAARGDADVRPQRQEAPATELQPQDASLALAKEVTAAQETLAGLQAVRAEADAAQQRAQATVDMALKQSQALMDAAHAPQAFAAGAGQPPAAGADGGAAAANAAMASAARAAAAADAAAASAAKAVGKADAAAADAKAASAASAAGAARGYPAGQEPRQPPAAEALALRTLERRVEDLQRDLAQQSEVVQQFSDADGGGFYVVLLDIQDEVRRLKVRAEFLERCVPPDVLKAMRYFEPVTTSSPIRQMRKAIAPDQDTDSVKAIADSAMETASGLSAVVKTLQRGAEMQESKLVDVVKVQKRVEALLPQLLQATEAMAQQLALKDADGGTWDGLADRLRSMLGNLADAGPRPSVSPSMLEEALRGAHEDVRALLQQLREDILATLRSKADAPAQIGLLSAKFEQAAQHPRGVAQLGLAGSAPAQEARVGEGGHPFNVPPVPFPQHAHRFGPHFGPLRPLDVPPPGWHEQGQLGPLAVGARSPSKSPSHDAPRSPVPAPVV